MTENKVSLTFTREMWFRVNVHEMSLTTLNRHRDSLEAELSIGNLSNSERMEVQACLGIVNDQIDEITPKMAAQIDDHDIAIGGRLLNMWPKELEASTRLIHNHFCELVFDWNMNPFRRDVSSATIDEYGETIGESIIVFVSKMSADDFIDHYDLSDFVVSRKHDAFHYVTLTNKFTSDQVNSFLNVYKSAMNALSELHEERIRAIRNDGGRVGFVCVDHFVTREAYELNRIKFARQILGAGYKDLNCGA